MEKLAIIILNWNNAPDTLSCLQSVSAIPKTVSYEIILVDNGSTDDSLIQIKQAFPHLTYVENGANLGFAEGNNRGILKALETGADYLFLLNNDTVVQPDILEAFLSAAHMHSDAAVFGAKIYYYDDPTCIWYAGGDVDSKTGRCIHLGCTESDLDKKWERVQETGYACGCALLIRAEAVKKIGLMDSRFFLIWEEVDWCWRLRKAGYRCLFVPAAKVWHKISASFEEGNRGPIWQYFYWRNRLLFIERHFNLSSKLLFLFNPLLREIMTLIATSLHTGKPLQLRRQHRAALLGLRDYCLRRFGSGSFEALSKKLK